MKTRALITCVAAVLGQSALAQSSGIEFTLGAGAQSAPGYFGSNNDVFGPTGSFSLERLRFGGLVVGEGGSDLGLGYHGGFRYIAPRKAADYPELSGLTDLDLSLELGGGLHYRTPDLYAYADVRYGVVGHEAVVGELGADLYYRPSNQLTFAAGPRMFWGSDDYAQTYFGVSDAEAAASSFSAFDATGGFLSGGLEASATYQFNDDWGVKGTVRYDVLRDDAALSPITTSDEQLSVGVVLTRRVSFGF